MFKLTKRELNEFVNFNKRLGITLDEYTNYIQNLRKVNAKSKRMKKAGNSFYTAEFSKKASAIPNRAVFNKRMEQFRYILQPGFRQVENINRRQVFINNLRDIIGNGVTAQRVISRFERMSDREILHFLKENRDLGALAYGSPDVVKDFLDENAQSVEVRLDLL